MAERTSAGQHVHPDLHQTPTPTPAMPGMVSQEQLEELRKPDGDRQSVLFPQLMLRHHQGGIAMAEHAAHHAVLPQTQSLAGQMAFDQQHESQALGQLLLQHGIDPRTGRS